MKKILIIIIVLFPTSSFALDSYDVYKTLSNSTVKISIWDNYNNNDKSVITWGTGVVINKIDNRFFILTNAHVMLEKYCLVLEPTKVCKDKTWGKDTTITIDAHESEFEYTIGENFVWWPDHDLAVIAVDIDEFVAAMDTDAMAVGSYATMIPGVFPNLTGSTATTMDLELQAAGTAPTGGKIRVWMVLMNIDNPGSYDANEVDRDQLA
mgnify:CR=1 FL=1